MEYIVAPWRGKYLQEGICKKECFLCEAGRAEDLAARFILAQNERTVVLLNLYPYTGGHILIAPKEHISSPLLASPELLSEMQKQTLRVIKILEESYHPHGFNVGMNIGRAAGAGVPDHFHLHIVPRWEGDANFMPLLGEVKVMFEGVEQTYQRLRPFFS